jgi:DNA helicase II / ATP-dependent DNA helicase PcrA
MVLDTLPLNPEQREAAAHFEGPLLVLAGAGSGKTRVLTARIAHLIEDYGVDPASILSLTFTNKAAGEMRERLRTLLGRDPAGMWVGTFHAIGVRILRRDATRLGWAPNFLIYDADDSESAIRRILKDQLNLDPKRWSPRAVRGAISAAKNELVDAAEYATRAADAFEKKVALAYELYDRTLREANAFDFDDLLVKPVQLFRSDPRALQRYREKFRFLLVDEYQDTNHAQYVALKLLAAEHSNLFVVGDDDQSIYGWRGADIRNILDFEKDFVDARVVRLEQNYRSTQTILEAANRVIAENLRRKGKTLRTANAEGERITLVETADEVDEADWIADAIRGHLALDEAASPRDFVVLYRTNAQSRAIEEAMRREGMPYRIIGGTRFYERREVKDVLAYLRLVANPADDEAFLRVVNVPRRGIGDTSIARLAEWANRQRVPLLAAAARVEEVPDVRGAAARALPQFAALIEKHAALAGRDLPLDELIAAVVREAGVLQALRDEGPEADERISHVEELIAGAAELQARVAEEDPELAAEIEAAGGTPLRPLDLFLAHVALVTDIDQHDASADAVSLMTLHNAKGLEFPVVFIGGLEEGLFPLGRASDTPEQLEEERRLFYVGITRAERKLYLATARRRRRGGEWLDSVPSSFLEAVPTELVEVRRSARLRERASGFSSWRTSLRSSVSTRRERLGLVAAPPPAAEASDAAGRVVDYSDSQDAPRLIKGARVRHPQFGGGTVLSLSGGGSDLRATIDFDSVGRKTVVLRYANLQNDWD